MLEGICPRCGLHLFGWALRNQQHKTCPDCGERLKIIDDKNAVVEDNTSITVKESAEPKKKDSRSE